MNKLGDEPHCSVQNQGAGDRHAEMTLARAAAAEAIGTALLLAIVVGSGIMGDRLAEGNAAIALLANSIATGTGLYVLIVIFGPVSGAHFNPVVSAVSVWDGRLSGHHGVVYMLTQVGGAFAGIAAAHAMFGMRIIQVSAHVRPTWGEGFGEVIRPCLGYIACAEISRGGDPDVSCSLYYECLLVHVLDIVCRSRRDVCARHDRHLRWNLSGKRAPLCRRAAAGRCSGHTVRALAAQWETCNFP